MLDLYLELISLSLTFLSGGLRGQVEECDHSNRYDHQCDLFEWVEEGLEDTTNYVEYHPGDLSLIISVPHDGFLKFRSVPDRLPGCKQKGGIKADCVFNATLPCALDQEVCRVVPYVDRNTRDMARGAWTLLKELTGRTPYLIINNIHRSQLDPNRDIPEATQFNKWSMKAYEEFHGKIELAKSEMKGHGLLIDFHGQTHKQNSTEVGYLYLTQELNNGTFDTRRPSIAALVERSGVPVEELLSGPDSLGAELEMEGVRAVPSPRQNSPGDDKYYRGGWITQVHGSRDGGSIDAIQLEFPSELRYEAGEAGWQRAVPGIARAIAKFYKRFYL